ncbi:MAG: DUF3467 domain-containing protein [Bacteroidia bacterium]
MDNKEQNQAPQLNVEVPAEIAGGVYSNLAVISHSNAEFVMDFLQVMPGVPKAEVRTRVIMTPFHAKRFLQAMADNVAKFENNFGSVDTGNNPGGPPTFGGPTGFA